MNARVRLKCERFITKKERLYPDLFRSDSERRYTCIFMIGQCFGICICMGKRGRKHKWNFYVRHGKFLRARCVIGWFGIIIQCDSSAYSV